MQGRGWILTTESDLGPSAHPLLGRWLSTIGRSVATVSPIAGGLARSSSVTLHEAKKATTSCERGWLSQGDHVYQEGLHFLALSS